MFILETQVLKFRLDLVESKTVSQRSVYVECLTCNLVLLACLHALKRAHIVKAVSYLDQNDAYVIIHGEQQFLEVLSLGRCLVTEYAACNLGQAIDYLGYLGAEYVLYVISGVVCVLYHIMQKG